MGTLTKKLHILKTGGTEETCNIYTTPEEVGGSPYLALEVDGTKGYVKLGSTTDTNATHLRVEKNGTTYAAWKQAVRFVNVTITQSANQTIHVYTPQKSGGTDHTSSFTTPELTPYEVEIVPVDGYTAGTLNVSMWGVFYDNMTFSASGAVPASGVIVKGSSPWYNTYVDGLFPWTDGGKVSNLVVTGDGAAFNARNVTTARHMFNLCKGLTSVDLRHFDTSQVTDMDEMFGTCTSLKEVTLANCDTSRVTDMGYMFVNCPSLTLVDLSNCNLANVTYMNYMFSRCTALQILYWDLNGYLTGNTTVPDLSPCTNLEFVYITADEEYSSGTLYRAMQTFRTAANIPSSTKVQLV